MAFITVTKGSEYWNTVETYKTELNYVEAKEDMLIQWENEPPRGKPRGINLSF